MPSTENFIASIDVLSLLRELLSSWTEWDANRAYYLGELLPELKVDATNATREEQQVMRRLRQTASPVEWQRLEWIAENLQAQEKQWWGFSQELERLLRSGDLIEAKKLASASGNPNVVAWCEARIGDRISQVSEKIQSFLERGDPTAAEEMLGRFRAAFSEDQCTTWMGRIESLRRANDISVLRGEIEEALGDFDVHRAESRYAQLRARYPEATIPEYEKRLVEAKRTQLEAELREVLEERGFDEARKLFEDNTTLISRNAFDQLVAEYHLKRELRLVTGLLETFRFADADAQVVKCAHISGDEYEALKANYITEYAKSRSFPMPNCEQARALATTSRHLLVQARAGSGKTRVAAQKTGLLLHDEVEDPDHILILAFNKSAAEEIGHRIRLQFGFDQYGNARTFHSLAWRLVLPTEVPLSDDAKHGVSYKRQSLFIQRSVIDKVMNPAFREKMYDFFRRELAEIEGEGLLLSREEYYVYRRSLQERTLGGQLVKSRGEKWIADFLFEHGVWYKYEKVYAWAQGIYRPDFSVYHRQHDYVIEHWAVDEAGTGELPKWWGKSTTEYVEEMRRKREYWSRRGVPLVETSVEDTGQGREHFEAILRRRLDDVGIGCHRVPEEELYDKLKRCHLSRFAKLATQFIHRAKKTGLSPSDIERRIDEYDASDERTSTFLRLAARIYQDYEEQKRQEDKIDYDDLLLEATERVHRSEGKCSFRVDHQRPVRVTDLRWIIIDEFQDFSPLFNGLIEAIRRYNSGVRLFCVGDDWQAINGFAGSDLSFFDGFEERYEESRRAELRTNHRSSRSIVHESNALMRGRDHSARPRDDAVPGLTQIEAVDDVWVELRSTETHAEEYAAHERFRFSDRKGNVDVLASRYLKRCCELMTAPENTGKKVAVLSRTNRIYSIPLRRFERQLVACLSGKLEQQYEDTRKSVRVSTVHRFKGLEEEVVILIRACEGSFPLLHSDNSLFTIFGRDEVDVLNEERRLFYVAMTRAKESLYILTERGRESPYLKELPAYGAYQRDHR